MTLLKVLLTKVIDDDQYSVFGEFQLIDYYGRTVIFLEKFPVVGVEYTNLEREIVNLLPLEVAIECIIISADNDKITIETKHDIIDVDQQSRFFVRNDSLIVESR